MNIIILLGRQGSGKSTQTELLVKEFDFTYIGSGEILRARSEEEDFTGKKIREVLEKGDYLPSVVMSMIWMEKLELLKLSADIKGIVLDGSPRKLVEAELLDQALDWYEWNTMLRVFLIDISRQEGFERLTHRRVCESCKKSIPWVGEYKNLTACDICGGNLIIRSDDTPAAINSRLDLFEKETIPVIEYYQKKGVLERVDGRLSMEDVYKSVRAQLL